VSVTVLALQIIDGHLEASDQSGSRLMMTKCRIVNFPQLVATIQGFYSSYNKVVCTYETMQRCFEAAKFSLTCVSMQNFMNRGK
jgi:hypothetical protein